MKGQNIVLEELLALLVLVEYERVPFKLIKTLLRHLIKNKLKLN